MNLNMLCPCQQLKILNVVIQWILIDMMNYHVVRDTAVLIYPNYTGKLTPSSWAIMELDPPALVPPFIGSDGYSAHRNTISRHIALLELGVWRQVDTFQVFIPRHMAWLECRTIRPVPFSTLIPAHLFCLCNSKAFSRAMFAASPFVIAGRDIKFFPTDLADTLDWHSNPPIFSSIIPQEGQSRKLSRAYCDEHIIPRLEQPLPVRLPGM